MVFRIAHLSDIHISEPLATLGRMWSGKRFLGGLNMLLFRRRQLRNLYFPKIVAHIQEQEPDLVLITGDLSTTSLSHEFATSKSMLQPFLEKNTLFVIPGNHDVYTKSAQKKNEFETFFYKAQGRAHADISYPIVRREKDVVLIGLNTCVPTGLSGSWGRIDSFQMDHVKDTLIRYKGCFRVILIHHFLQDKHGQAGLPKRGLRNRREFMDILEEYGAELVLHGHEHAVYSYSIKGPKKNIPVFNPGPATRHSLTHESSQGGYHLYEIENKALKSVSRFHFQPLRHSFQKKSIDFPTWKARDDDHDGFS